MTLRRFIKLVFEGLDPEDRDDISHLMNKQLRTLTVGQLLEVSEDLGIPVEDLVSDILVQRCKKCGCTNNDCRQCIKKTGEACYWFEEDLCSACAPKWMTKNMSPGPQEKSLKNLIN